MTVSLQPIQQSTTQLGILGALRVVLLGMIPTAGVEIVVGQVNKVPEPKAADYVVMTPTRRRRLATNTDSWNDCKFIGSISGPTMTVTEVDFGTIVVGAPVFGVGVLAGTSVKALGTGTGGIGTYTVTPSQIIGARVLAAGTESILQPTELTVQLDVHGPSAGDNAQIISTLMRDDYAYQAFLQAGVTGITPLYADDPKQMPFINAASLYESRWVVEALLQVDETVLNIPQQYADVLRIGLIDVDAAYPP